MDRVAVVVQQRHETVLGIDHPSQGLVHQAEELVQVLRLHDATNDAGDHLSLGLGMDPGANVRNDGEAARKRARLVHQDLWRHQHRHRRATATDHPGLIRQHQPCGPQLHLQPEVLPQGRADQHACRLSCQLLPAVAQLTTESRVDIDQRRRGVGHQDAVRHAVDQAGEELLVHPRILRSTRLLDHRGLPRRSGACHCPVG